VVLGELIDEFGERQKNLLPTPFDRAIDAACILHWYYLPPPPGRKPGMVEYFSIGGVEPWWQENKADLRRRAKELP
jgi:hypothetical protein